MNKIFITNQPNPATDDHTYTLNYEQANKMLPILRSDHFKLITLANTHGLDVKSLKFLIQITRLLKNDGSVVLQGQRNEEVKGLLLKLNIFEGAINNDGVSFSKTKPEVKIEEKVSKLSIGFNPNQQQTIDEDDLLKGQNLDISKKQAEKCDTKPKACANCSCGRKDAEKNGPVPVGELVQSINEGKVMTGCGKCSLGDSFRCGTCPFKGFPAFKPGDKLKLMEQGGVVVEEGATFVSATGKVKLEI